MLKFPKVYTTQFGAEFSEQVNKSSRLLGKNNLTPASSNHYSRPEVAAENPSHSGQPRHAATSRSRQQGPTNAARLIAATTKEFQLATARRQVAPCQKFNRPPPLTVILCALTRPSTIAPPSVGHPAMVGNSFNFVQQLPKFKLIFIQLLFKDKGI
ncbi:uncharacterized protein [Spinacia oleracea]|uniref:Uncharacterized protein isoform X1 n=1 Tax=Spinacia oleracea TaxID=3562 RepID=A0ABM3QK33_SPIOL|nr:uncharacterized protein LOC130460092 isoform X1 [Spinacia oleracea]